MSIILFNNIWWTDNGGLIKTDRLTLIPSLNMYQYHNQDQRFEFEGGNLEWKVSKFGNNKRDLLDEMYSE